MEKKDVFKLIIIVIVIIAIAVSLMFIFGVVEIQYIKTIGKEKQNAQREVFKETKSYNDGMIQNLIKYKHEYDMADNEHKIIISNTIRLMYAEYDETKIKSIELKEFLKKIKY